MAGRVRVLPSQVVLEVHDGETVFQAAARLDVRWPSICHGDCECGVCFMVVQCGAEYLSDKSKIEADRLALGLKANDPAARLACRTKVDGDATVVRRGVRPRQ